MSETATQSQDAEWTTHRLQELLAQQVPEDFRLDYKGKNSLPLPVMTGDVKHAKRQEIGKDATAFANSDGGVIIYGIKEGKLSDGRPVPLEFEPISLGDISRDQLAQIIADKSEPTLIGVRVIPVQSPSQSDPSMVCFVVVVPPSNTAHMAGDGCYYFRNEAITSKMHDWQVRDAMNRIKFPKFKIEAKKFWTFDRNSKPELRLWVKIENVSGVIAKLYRITVRWPKSLLSFGTDIRTDVMPFDPLFSPNTSHDFIARDDPFGPYFPGFSLEIVSQIITSTASAYALLKMKEHVPEHLEIEIFADNMPMQIQRLLINDIPEQQAGLTELPF